MYKEPAIVLTNGILETDFAKTCHGLLRGTDRFDILAVIDHKHAGKDAGEVMDGRKIGVPVYATVADFFQKDKRKPVWCVVGVAFAGGKLPGDFRQEIRSAIEYGLSIVCGLHTLLSEDPEFSKLAAEKGVRLLDVRKPRPASELRFWTGEIFKVAAPRIAVLGIDCAIGKRTTCRFLTMACRKAGINAEMIYTGQTGWMQGYPHGFIFDTTINDFLGGEIERALVECDRESKPDIMFIEGQSALQNPTGPCGSEFLLSGQAKGVVLQHVPFRKHYEDTEVPLKSIESEIQLIRLYGAEVLAVTLNGEGRPLTELKKEQRRLERELNLPVALPLEEGVDDLIPLIRQYIEDQRSRTEMGD